MMDREKHQTEWENPDNWGGPPWMAVYFSKNDPRTWVPKRIPKMGWTLNLAHTSGVCWLIGLLAGIPSLLFVGMLVMTIAAAR